MKEQPAISSTFNVGNRYRCTTNAPVPVPVPGQVIMVTVEWEPHVQLLPLTKRDARDYRRGRDLVAAGWSGGSAARCS